MGLAADPRYVSLARRAAGKLGSSSTPIVNAILAQWQCELGAGDAYPPNRNNPGNLAAGAAQSVGARYTVAAGSNPQPGNPIVTFPSPEAGADAYGKLLATLGRYAPVRSAVVARDGRAFLQAISAAGYGTSLSCALSVYGGSSVPGAGGSFGGSGLPGTPGPVGLPVVATDYAAKFIALLARLGISTDPAHVISHAEAVQIVGSFGTVFGAGAHPMAANFEGRTVAQAAGSLQSSGAAIADPVGALLSGVPGILANVAVVAGIGLLAYVGLRNLADGLGQG